jgi:hypothetical protein
MPVATPRGRVVRIGLRFRPIARCSPRTDKLKSEVVARDRGEFFDWRDFRRRRNCAVRSLGSEALSIRRRDLFSLSR